MIDCYSHTNGKLRFCYYPQIDLLVIGNTVKRGNYKFATEGEFRRFCDKHS